MQQAAVRWRVGDDGDLVEVPEQQAAIRRVRNMRAKGMSLRAISAALAKQGVRLSHEGVKRIVLPGTAL